MINSRNVFHFINSTEENLLNIFSHMIEYIYMIVVEKIFVIQECLAAFNDTFQMHAFKVNLFKDSKIQTFILINMQLQSEHNE